MYSRHRPRWLRLSGTLAGIGVATWLVSLAGVYVWARRDAARPASAIVVLGAAQYAGRPSPVLRARLDHALALYHRGLAGRIVFTGGRGEGDTTSEAEVGRRYAIRRGVPRAAILVETNGRTTRESLAAVGEMMGAVGHTDVILVSDGFHMLRLWILAKRFGLDPIPSPTRTSPIAANRDEERRYMLQESVKVPLAFFLEQGRPVSREAPRP